LLWGEDFMKLSEKIKRSIAGKERTTEESENTSTQVAEVLMGVKEGLLSGAEIDVLKNLLLDYQTSTCDISSDFSLLTSITSEIKSINHQSVLLHGEKIKAAKELFSAYGELAFSSWLKEVYGNRQTPYNLLKYYLFYTSLSKELQDKMLAMPKQIVYTIASRNCSEADKISVIDTYDGESKETFLKAIRKAFPVERKMKRPMKKEHHSKRVISLLESALELIEANKAGFSYEELRLIDSSTKLISKHLWED